MIGIPVPLLLIWAPAWGWIIAANLLLGVNQGLAWSMTVNMKMDLAGPRWRGLVLGFNEPAGYQAQRVAILSHEKWTLHTQFSNYGIDVYCTETSEEQIVNGRRKLGLLMHRKDARRSLK